MGMIREFRDFAVKGSVVDMAVGIIIGAAFGTIVKSLVADVLMPPIGLLLGNVDFSNLFIVLQGAGTQAIFSTLADAQAAGAVTLNYGQFINTVIGFVIVAFAVFVVIRNINRLKRQEAAAPPPPAQKGCPFCFSTIAIRAIRCPHCTSELAQA